MSYVFRWTMRLEGEGDTPDVALSKIIERAVPAWAGEQIPPGSLAEAIAIELLSSGVVTVDHGRVTEPPPKE